MTVTQIVSDLLKHNMITPSAAILLLNADIKAKAYEGKTLVPTETFNNIKGEVINWTLDEVDEGLPYWYITSS